MKVILVALALLASAPPAGAKTPFESADPLKAFVHGEYPLGSDYFINGGRDTTLLRCIADFDRDGRPDVALSEKSIWGNRSGPFELFVQRPNGRYRYLRTADFDSELKSACAQHLESCASNEYLASGKCQWQKGWPR